MSKSQNQSNSLNEQEKQKLSKWVTYLMILMMIITGSINTIANKLQNISISLDKKYNQIRTFKILNT